ILYSRTNQERIEEEEETDAKTGDPTLENTSPSRWKRDIPILWFAGGCGATGGLSLLGVLIFNQREITPSRLVIALLFGGICLVFGATLHHLAINSRRSRLSGMFSGAVMGVLLPWMGFFVFVGLNMAASLGTHAAETQRLDEPLEFFRLVFGASVWGTLCGNIFCFLWLSPILGVVLGISGPRDATDINPDEVDLDREPGSKSESNEKKPPAAGFDPQGFSDEEA
ncbi:MAG: hypothetical protein N2C14_23060, partial [Planctomycetales bacterium]